MAASVAFPFASSPTPPHQLTPSRAAASAIASQYATIFFKRKETPQKQPPRQRQSKRIDSSHMPQSVELHRRRDNPSETAQLHCTPSWKANCNEPIQRHRPQRRSSILEPERREPERRHPPRKSHRNRHEHQQSIRGHGVAVYSSQPSHCSEELSPCPSEPKVYQSLRYNIPWGRSELAASSPRLRRRIEQENHYT